MRINCPYNCSEVSLKTGRCKNGHQFQFEYGVLKLITKDFENTLYPFLEKFNQSSILRKITVKNTDIYNELPFHHSLKQNRAWKVRRNDLSIIMDYIKDKKSLNVLEIGPWNGWLTNQMAKSGHTVLAIGYFIDPPNGLGSKQFYTSDWQALQMNVEALEIIDGPFDLIILNRNFATFTNPLKTFLALKNKLAESGSIIATGLTFYKNSKFAELRHQKLMSGFKKENGFEMFFKEPKGFFDYQDLKALEMENMVFTSYKKPILKSLVGRLINKTTRYCFGVYNR